MTLYASSYYETPEKTIKFNSPTVKTVYGDIRGIYQDGVHKYYGIPFAKPPLNELRFAPPQDAEPWSGVLDCVKKKPSALQVPDKSNTSYSEDCLYLNVWTPRTAKEGNNLPVLVYIHGGGFAMGSHNAETYNGIRFARDGVIQVNLPYRLNAFGFTAFEEIESKYGYLGNMAILDQIKGLKWVQDNIKAFGGNPKNVTLCGESAGSMCIANMLLSKDAEGLFHRVIMESGTCLAQQVVSSRASGNKYQAISNTRKLMNIVNAESVEDMEKIDGTELVDNSIFSFDMTKQTPQYFFPIFDGKLVPERPYDALIDGKVHPIDILVGFNADEGSIFIPSDTTVEDYENYMFEAFGDDAEKVKKRFPVDSENSIVNRLRYMVKLCLAGTTQVYADVLSDKGQNAYMYEFAYATDRMKQLGLGTYHGFELNFVFDTLAPSLKNFVSERIKNDVHQRWLNFIVNGNPNIGGEFEMPWPQYFSDEKQVLRFNENNSIETSPFGEDLEFLWEILW